MTREEAKDYFYQTNNDEFGEWHNVDDIIDSLFDHFEQQLKELNDYYLKRQEEDAEHIVSKGLKIYELKQQLKWKDAEVEFTKHALLKASDQVVKLEAEERNLHRDIEELESKLKEVDVRECELGTITYMMGASNAKKQIEILKAKLEKHENPVAEFDVTGTGNGAMLKRGDALVLPVGKYRVIVLEGGE